MKNKLPLLLSIIAVPVIIYFYFLRTRTYTIYGDDLSAFLDYDKAHSYADIMGIATIVDKYRPVCVLVTKLLYTLFHKNLACYYLFNVLIQSINTCLVAVILNLFLRTPLMSLCFSMLFGLSRLSFYITSQPLSGGALEGLAMTFFLASLYFVLKGVLHPQQTTRQARSTFLLAILFANLSLYTHERYIIMLPFIILVLVFFPGLKTLHLRQKAVLISITLATILANVVIKKYIYGMPFMVGTGGTNISFSFTTAKQFIEDGILSIIQVNTGNPSHFGMQYAELSTRRQQLQPFYAAGLVLILLIYLALFKRILRTESGKPKFYTFLSLAVLFVFCLAPAVVTIRLEQRWLVAPFAIFLIMTVIALSGFEIKNAAVRNGSFLLFIACFIYSDGNYYKKGSHHLYVTYAQNSAAVFEQAIKDGTIRPESSKLYVWQAPEQVGSEGDLNWYIGGGNFFWFYQDRAKKMVFVNPAVRDSVSNTVIALQDFRPDSAQIIYLKGSTFTDITAQYQKDSLRNFKY